MCGDLKWTSVRGECLHNQLWLGRGRDQVNADKKEIPILPPCTSIGIEYSFNSNWDAHMSRKCLKQRNSWLSVRFTDFHCRWFRTEISLNICQFHLVPWPWVFTEILVYILCLKKICLNCESNQPALESIHPLVLEDSSLGCCKPVNLLKFGVSFWLKGRFEAKIVGWTNTMSKRWYSRIVDFSKRKQAELLANCYGVMWYFFEIWVMEN
jgi:hypothetical protein